MTKTNVSPEFPYESYFIDVYGSKMHYIMQGEGDPILFLHGVPTSSYIWRNVIPHLTTLGCCIAPDLIGFGKSAKPDIEYSISDHIKYIEKFIETLKLDRITIIMHGWGSIIGFDYAMKHESKCKGLVFYEAYLRAQGVDEAALPYHEQMVSWQENDNAADLMINGIHFIDAVLSQGLMRSLSEKELNYYREPFKNAGSEKPISRYLQDLLNDDDAKETNQIIAQYSKKLTYSFLPKLMLYSVPGFITTIASAMWAKKHLPNLELVDIGEELHYAQESNPVLMGETISIWLQSIEQSAL